MIYIDRRTKKILVRVCDEEYEIIKAKASDIDQPVAVYIRRMAIQGEIKKFDLTEVNNLTRAFNMIGTELNQIANFTGQVTAKAMEEVRHQQDVLKKLMDKYLKQLKPNVVL